MARTKKQILQALQKLQIANLRESFDVDVTVQSHVEGYSIIFSCYLRKDEELVLDENGSYIGKAFYFLASYSVDNWGKEYSEAVEYINTLKA